MYVVQASNGRFYRRGKLVQSRNAASYGWSPSGAKGILDRARKTFPELEWTAVPFRENAAMAQTSKQKQEDFRARMTLLGLKEVRGIYLPEAMHPALKDYATKLLEQHEPERKKAADGC